MKKPRYTRAFIDRHGKPRFYLRQPGLKEIPLPGLPWSPEFMAAYEAGTKGDWNAVQIGSNKTVPGTVNAAIVSYYNLSLEFKGMAPGTQKMRRAILERFREEHGDKRVALVHEEARSWQRNLPPQRGIG
jgi:hypothetical protein